MADESLPVWMLQKLHQAAGELAMLDDRLKTTNNRELQPYVTNAREALRSVLYGQQHD